MTFHGRIEVLQDAGELSTCLLTGHHNVVGHSGWQCTYAIFFIIFGGNTWYLTFEIMFMSVSVMW